eukprot:11858464-Ditylum_brightwellii.AAC.1
MEITGHDITLWDTYLHINSGILELTKTAYNMLVWQFADNGTPSIMPESQLSQNTVQVLHNDIPTTIKQVSKSKSLKLLGTLSALDQNTSASVSHLKSIITKFANNITVCPLSQTEVYIAYTTVFLPSLIYSLLSTTITL